MTYRSLLVFLARDAGCATRTRAAIRLARQFEAHLVGAAPTGLLDLPMALDPTGSLGEFANLAWQTLRDQAEQAAQGFEAACAAAGLASFASVIDEEDAPVSLLRHARCSDLVVLSQADPKARDDRAMRRLVEQTVLHSARPTLLIPYAGHHDVVGSHVMVAWDDSREAARAVLDALPMLRQARRVRVVSWNESGAGDANRLGQRLEALRHWLLRHGVTAETSVECTDIGIADAMLSRATDLESNLIVMGAYGHQRWTERMLGGATRGLLDAMTVPVLMSH